jgi:chromosome segregation ATPase
MKNKYKKQLQLLILVNNTHIQKQENELAKLNGKKKKLLEDLDEKDKAITALKEEKNHFKVNYFPSLPSKIFNMEQVNFFRNTLESYESRVMEARKQKEKVQKEIEVVEAAIIKHRAALKKYTFKNEKYDVLKLTYG